MWTLAIASAAALWATWPSHRVLRSEPEPGPTGLYEPATRTVRLYAARNEVVAFQVVIPGPRAAVTAHAGPLRGADGELAAPTLLRAWFLRHGVVSQYGGDNPVPDSRWWDTRRRVYGAAPDYPEPLVPLHAPRGGAPFDTSVGSNEVLWVEFRVPADQPPGLYTGTLAVAEAEFAVQCRVWNFTLPHVSHFPAWIYTGPEFIAWAAGLPHTDTERLPAQIGAYHRMAREHRVCLGEGLVYDVGHARAGTPAPLDLLTGVAFAGTSAAGWGYELAPVEPDSLELVAAEHAWHRAFVYLHDEPGSLADYERVLERGRAVAEAGGGRLRRMVTAPLAPRETGWPDLGAEVDIFCVPGGVGRADIEAAERKGKAVWTYNQGIAGAPYTDAPGPALRSHAWAGYLTGARAWYFWHGVYVVDKHNAWRGRMGQVYADPVRHRGAVWEDPLTFDESRKRRADGSLYPLRWSLRLNGDGLLFYPGEVVGLTGPVAGLRLKNLRMGAQDFEYLYLLEKAGRGDFAREIAERLLRWDHAPGDLAYETDPAAWDLARFRLGSALDAIGDAELRRLIRPYEQYPNPTGAPDRFEGRRF